MLGGYGNKCLYLQSSVLCLPIDALDQVLDMGLTLNGIHDARKTSTWFQIGLLDVVSISLHNPTTFLLPFLNNLSPSLSKNA